MAHLTQCFGFDLADALPGDIELFPDFFQRVVIVHANAKAHSDYFGFPFSQAVQNVAGCTS